MFYNEQSTHYKTPPVYRSSVTLDKTNTLFPPFVWVNFVVLTAMLEFVCVYVFEENASAVVTISAIGVENLQFLSPTTNCYLTTRNLALTK